MENALSRTLEEFTKVVDINTAVITAQQETIADLLEALEELISLTKDLAPQDIGSGKKTLISNAIGKAMKAIASN